MMSQIRRADSALVGFLYGKPENTNDKSDLISDQDKLGDRAQEWDLVSHTS